MTIPESDDGPSQPTVFVDLKTLLMFLATIQTTRVAEHLREKLIAYQREVADVIEAYWTQGGVINPRASEDQLAGIIQRAQGQAAVLRALDGIVDPRWLEAKARHVAARALGEEPEVDPESRPLTVGEYLQDHGVTAKAARSVSSEFGRRMKAAYLLRTGEAPGKTRRFVDGAERMVAVYTEAERPLFDEVWQQLASRT